MADFAVDADRLYAFEQGLNSYAPEKSTIPARILGYGEISAVLEIENSGDSPVASALVYKRMPMFRSAEEVQHYSALYQEYVTMLAQVGVHPVSARLCSIDDPRKGRSVLYIVQEKLPAESIGNQVIRRLPTDEVCRLVLAVVAEIQKVFDFNCEQQGRLELGMDGQISNWAIQDLNPAQTKLDDPIRLICLDTGTPLLRRNGQEQLNPEWFLRSAPVFLAWILKLLFLKELMSRYYDFRQVAIDLVANFYKEQRADLVPALVDAVNDFLAQECQAQILEPLTVQEVRAYYRQDAWIWRVYLAARRFDRALQRLLGREYPYILPGPIRR